MEWDQLLFKKAIHWLQHKKANESSSKICLKDVKNRLTVLARSLTGRNIDIYPAEEEGGFAGDVFFLPESVSIFQDSKLNWEFYLFRTAYMGIQCELNHGWVKGKEPGVVGSRLASINASPIILERLFLDCPGIQTTFQQLVRVLPNESPLLWGKWMPLLRKHKKDLDPVLEPFLGSKSELVPKTEAEGPAREWVESVTVDRKAIEDYTLMHQFEKVETLESFNGNWRDLDGDDDLKSHSEALKEVDLRHTIRTHDPAHSTLRSEFLRNSFIPFSKDKTRPGHHINYPEWNYKKRIYLNEFCKVYPSKVNQSEPGFVNGVCQKHRQTFESLRKRLGRFSNAWKTVHHQPSGHDLDLDRYINAHSDRAAKVDWDEAFYLNKRRKSKDLSILFLLDLSLSTDSYVKDMRILDVEKESISLFSQVLNTMACRFRIDGFSSQTRNNCDYLSIKEFDEPWENSKDRLGALQPAGYTRIGPALRHATNILKKEETRNKWIILVSDGKPNDFDRYEGRYGIEDVRQALREAKQEGINGYALAVDEIARFYLPRMFGKSTFRILNQPAKLVDALGDFFIQLNRCS